MKKKIIIIGAGPAGLFAAYRLVSNSPRDVQVKIFDSGGTIEQRVQIKDVLRGMGGGGLMSDGKLNFDIRIGNNLGEVLPQKDNIKLTREVKEIFSYFGVLECPLDSAKANELEKRALQNGIEFVYAQSSHIGTDKLIPLIRDFQKYLEERGVEFYFNREISSLKQERAEFFVLAPGRIGGSNMGMEKILQENGISYSYRPVDIGVRVEVPSLITEDITNISRDMKCYIRTETHQDRVRTFCACPNGFVGQEFHDGFKTVNGHSESGKSTNNTNFALLATIPLTKPVTNSNEYAKWVGLLFNGISGGKTLSQRWGDLVRHKRSKEEKQIEYSFQPTLQDVTWGDLALAMPPRYLTDLTEGIQRLDRIIPGLASDSTVLHAPEIKFHGLKISADEYLRAKEGIYVAGDGSGFSRGIVGAAASGLRTAEGILREI